MNELPSWRPLSDRRSQAQRLLEMAIRDALPSNAVGAAPSHGLWEGVPSTPGTHAGRVVVLRRLEWHRQEALVVSRRGMWRWDFTGAARVAGRHVDFRGEGVRDAETGAFHQMRVHSVGLPADGDLGS